MKVKVDKTDLSKVKMTPEELELWLHYRKKCCAMKKKKGKGSYTRKEKHKSF